MLERKISKQTYIVTIICFTLLLIGIFGFLYQWKFTNTFNVKAEETDNLGIEMRINPNTGDLEWHHTQDRVENDPWKVLATQSEITGNKGPQGIKGETGKQGLIGIPGSRGSAGPVICQ